MLTADDPLPLSPRRVVVAGVSGSGKTRLAGRVGAALDLPHTEIDALFHGPDWTPRESFVDDSRDHVIRWSIRTRNKYAVLVSAALEANPQLPCVRLRSQSEVDRWVTRLEVWVDCSGGDPGTSPGTERATVWLKHEVPRSRKTEGRIWEAGESPAQGPLR